MNIDSHKLALAFLSLSLCGCMFFLDSNRFHASPLMMPQKLTTDTSCSLVTVPNMWTVPPVPEGTKVGTGLGEAMMVRVAPGGSILVRSYADVYYPQREFEAVQLLSKQIARLSGEPLQFDSYSNDEMWQNSKIPAIGQNSDHKWDFEQIKLIIHEVFRRDGEHYYWHLLNPSETFVASVSYQGEEDPAPKSGGQEPPLILPSAPPRIPKSTIFFKLISLHDKKLISEFVVRENSGAISYDIRRAAWFNDKIFLIPQPTYINQQTYMPYH